MPPLYWCRVGGKPLQKKKALEMTDLKERQSNIRWFEFMLWMLQSGIYFFSINSLFFPWKTFWQFFYISAVSCPHFICAWRNCALKKWDRDWEQKFKASWLKLLFISFGLPLAFHTIPVPPAVWAGRGPLPRRPTPYQLSCLVLSCQSWVRKGGREMRETGIDTKRREGGGSKAIGDNKPFHVGV